MYVESQKNSFLHPNETSLRWEAVSIPGHRQRSHPSIVLGLAVEEAQVAFHRRWAPDAWVIEKFLDAQTQNIIQVVWFIGSRAALPCDPPRVE